MSERTNDARESARSSQLRTFFNDDARAGIEKTTSRNPYVSAA